MFQFFGLLPLYQLLNILPLLVEQMESGMLYAIWAILAALVFLGISSFVSRRAFAKHQV